MLQRLLSQTHTRPYSHPSYHHTQLQVHQIAGSRFSSLPGKLKDAFATDAAMPSARWHQRPKHENHLNNMRLQHICRYRLRRALLSRLAKGSASRLVDQFIPDIPDSPREITQTLASAGLYGEALDPSGLRRSNALVKSLRSLMELPLNLNLEKRRSCDDVGSHAIMASSSAQKPRSFALWCNSTARGNLNASLYFLSKMRKWLQNRGCADL